MQIQYVDDQKGAYRAGACNIGPEEIARRRRGAVSALAVTAVIAMLLVVVDAPPLLRLVVFPPLAGAIISLEQVRRRFCVAFGMAGIRNFGSLGSTESVAEGADRAADRRVALTIVAYGSALALAITLVFVALPV